MVYLDTIHFQYTTSSARDWNPHSTKNSEITIFEKSCTLNDGRFSDYNSDSGRFNKLRFS